MRCISGVRELKDNIIVINSLKYIENNLRSHLTAEDIAKEAGYSLFHFSRIFKKQMGSSIMEYVKDRRLIKASEEIVNGRKIIDAALDYDYQTHSGFTKAFKNKFGFSPALLRAFHFQINCLGGNDNMSHVFMKSTNIHTTKEELYEILKDTIKGNMLQYDIKKIKAAYDFACEKHEGEKRYCGDDYVTHPINVAIILAEMGADEDTVVAGLLHDINLKRPDVDMNELINKFSKRVATIVMDTKKIRQICNEVKDESVIMVALADRLHNMRTIDFVDKAKWKMHAKETLDLFLPIAARINNEKITAELNDLSLKYI